MNNDIKILIGATLNVGTTIGDINTAIKGIEKKINKLKLKVEIDDKVTKTLNDFSKAMENQKKINQDLNRVLREEKTITKELDGTIKENIRHHLKSGEIIQKEIERRNQKNKVIQQEAKNLNSLTENYNKLIKEVERYDKAGNLKGKTSTYTDPKGNARTITTDTKGNVIGYKDVENLEKFEKAQVQLRNSLIQLARTGKYTNDELKQIGKGINIATTLKELDQMKAKLNGLQISDSLSYGQDKLRNSLKQLYDQGKVNEQFFKNFNKVIDSSKNISEINKISDALKRVQQNANNKNLQTKLLSDAKTLLNSNAKGLDRIGLTSLIRDLQAVPPSAKNASNSLKQMESQLLNIKRASNEANKSNISLLNAVSQAAIKFPLWAGISTIFYTATNSVQALIDNIYALDLQLVSIEKVLNNSDISSVFDNATVAAFKYGQTIENTLKSLGEISKLGFDLGEAEELNNNSMLLSTVGEFKDATDAANYLVAIMRQYKLEVSDTVDVVNSLNSVSNQTGATTEGIAQALSKSSANAAMAGVSFHELTGMVSQTVETLKISGNEAGTFYKTLFSRYLREESQSMIEGLGIKTKEMSGELRSATDVLSDLGSQWETFDAQTKNAISSQLGGGWHVAKVTSLLEKQTRVAENTIFSMDSYNSAVNEMKVFEGGLEYQTNQMIASFQLLSQTIGDNGVRQLIVLLLNSVTSLTTGFARLTEMSHGLNIYLPLIAAGAYGAVKAFKALQLASWGVKASFGWIGLGVVAIELLAGAFMGSSKASDINTESLYKNAQATDNQRQRLEGLIAQYNELAPSAGNNAQKQEELQSVLQNIQQIAPHLIESTGEYGNALSLNKEKADQYIGTLKEMTKEQLLQASTANGIEINTVNVDLDEVNNDLKAVEDAVKQRFDSIQKYQKEHGVFGTNDADKEYVERTKQLNKELSKSIEDGSRERSDKIRSQLMQDEIEYRNYVNNMKDSSGQLVEYSENVAKVQELEGKKKGLEERQKAMDEMTNSLDSNSKANIENADALSNVDAKAKDTLTATLDTEAAMGDLSGSVDGASSSLEGMGDSATNAAGDMGELKTVAEQLTGISSQNISAMQEQIGVYQMLSEQENLSANMKTMLTNATNILSEAYPHLIDGKNLNILAMQEELDANNLLLQAVELSAEGQLSAQEQQTVNAALGAKARIEIIKQEIKALEEAQNVYLSRITAQNEHGGDDLRSEKNYMITQNKIGSLESELAKIKIPEFKGFKSKLEGIVNSTNRGTSATKGNTKSTKDNTKAKKDNKKATEENIEAYKNSIYVADAFKIKLDEINAALTKQNNLKAKFASHSENYRKALREEIKLLEKQKKLTQDEAKSLANQIKSGKIKETGVIDISNSVTSGSSKDKAPAGAYKGKYHAEINKAANTYGVDPFLIASIIKKESSFNSKAVSSAGAKGLMQLMPGTAKYLGVKNSFDPLQNIMGGTKYIAQMLAKTGGDIKKALIAYNAGMGNLNKVLNSKSGEWKEPKDYYNKVLSYYKDYTGANYSNGNKASKASTTPSPQSQSSNAKSVADYYFNNFKITSNLGDKESFRSKPHQGTDFANGKAGSPIKAVNSGKVLVSGWSDSAGNWVVVKQDDGTVAKYMHMLKKPDVKKGQRVDAGTILGKVGNTGDSYGAHLHLQIEANGKPIDAVKYLKQLQNTVNTGVSKVTDINYPTSEKTVADQLAAIDQAKAELLELNSDVSNLEQQILDLKDQIVQSYVDEFEYKKNIQKNKVQDLENRTYHLDTSSKEYRKNLEEQRKSVNEQQRINELEIKKVKYLLSLKEITAKKREELKGTLTDLMNERYEIADKRDATTLNIINSAMAEYAERVEKVDFLLGESEYNLSNYNDTSKEYRAELERQNELLYQKDTQLFYQIQALEEYLKKEKLTTEALKEKQKELAALKEAYRESTNSLKENANAKIEWTFRVSDKSIDDAVQKIEFIEYKMSLLSDDAGLEVKSGLFDEMNNELIKVNAELETAIQQTIKLRTETAVKGGDTGIFDDRLDSLLEQRRSNVQKLKQNYQDMLSNVEEAKSKIEEAESKANEEASKQFDKLLRDTEKNINAFQKIIDKANNSIELLETDQFTRKQELLGEALLATKNKANQIIAEFNQLRNVTVYSEEDAEALRSRLEQLKQELVDTNKSTIEYVKALEQVNFDSLTHEARLADAEIERLNNRLRSNMELLDGGLLSGTDLDFSFSIPQGSSLDLASFINDPISDIETEEIRIQNIRESSYGEQIRQAEAFHEQMKQQAEQYRMSLVEAEKQFQEAIQKQIEESDKKIADAKAKADKNDKNKAKLSQKEEKQQLEQHIKDIEAAMAVGLSNYSGAYSQQWDGVLKVLEQKLQEAKSKLDSLLAVEYQADNVNVPSDSNGGKKISKSPRANDKTYVPDRKPSKSPRAGGVPAYQKGTDSHNGGLALISEQGKELVVLPNGKTFVSSDNGAELVDLPKGSHVIPNKQTEMLLKSNSSPTVKNIPAYANGTWDWDRLMWDNEYWAAYLRGSDPQAYNQMMDNQNGYNSNDYYRDDQGYLIDKRDGSWVQPSYDVPYYSSDYTPPSNNYYEPSYNEPYYDYNDYYNGSSSNYYPDYNPAPYIPSADESAQSRLNELRSSKATVYSDKFVSKYDPYNKYGSIYENTRKGKQTSIKGLQQQLDAIENSSNTSDIKDLTEQILNKQNEISKEDMSFLIESLTDLSEQREKNARALKEELIRELESTDMTEEMRNQYREEIMRQDDIIAQSLKERKSLVGEMFEYEQKLREKRLHMIKEDEQNIQRIIAETKLNNPDDPKLIELNNQLLQQQAKYTGEIAKIRTELINQMKQYEVGSYEWNLLNQQLLQNEIGYQKDRLSNLDEENDKEERNIALKEKKDELEKVKKDKRFSIIDKDGNETLTYDKGKVADLEKEIADIEKQYRKDDIKEEYSKELALLEERLNNGIQMSPEQLAESQKYLDSLVEMYKKLNVKDVETKHSGGIIGDVPASPLQELVNKLFNTKPNEQIVKGQLGELMIPSKNIPNLFTNIGNLVNSIIPRNQPQAATVQHHYHFQDVTVKANNMDEFLGSLEHYNRTK